MAEELADMVVRVATDDSKFTSGMQRVENRCQQGVRQMAILENQSLGLFNRMSSAAVGAAGSIASAFAKIGIGAIAGLTASLAGVGGVSIKLASDFEETRSKFGFLFQEMKDETATVLDAFGKRVGRARGELYEFAASFQGITRQLGVSEEEASSLSATLTKLAVDLGSFNNKTDADAAAALQSGLVGNHEALRSLNVFITEATLKTELMNMGFRGSMESASEAQKQMARLSIILRETAVAQGDAERTSGSFSNQMKAMWATLKETGLEIGNALIPSMQVLLSAFVDMMNVIRQNSADWQKWGSAAKAGIEVVMGYVREAAFLLYNYDLAWGYLGVTVMQKLADMQASVQNFANSASGGFKWLQENAVDIMLVMANNILSTYINMAENIQNVFTELWDYIATMGEDAIDISMKSLTDGWQKVDTSGLAKAMESDIKAVDLSGLKTALDNEYERRKAKMEADLAGPAETEAGQDRTALKLPASQKAIKEKVQVEIVKAEDIFRKALVDNFKKSSEKQQLEMQQEQLKVQQGLRQDQAAQHMELVRTIKDSGALFV